MGFVLKSKRMTDLLGDHRVPGRHDLGNGRNMMHSRHTILIIEKEKILVDLLAHELANYDIRVASAATLAEGRTMLGQIHPDLIVLDPEVPPRLGACG